MVNLKEIIRNFFSIHKIDIDSSKVVIGVSTGVDSMVLLDLMLNYTNSKVIIAHVNHGKRAQSSEEEKFILEYANSKSIPCYVYHIQKEEISNGNFQEEARKIRYNFFKDVMKKENVDLFGYREIFPDTYLPGGNEQINHEIFDILRELEIIVSKKPSKEEIAKTRARRKPA